MKVLFITAIQDLIISENLGRGDRISPELFITNDLSFIKSLLTDEFRLMAGKLETDFILTSNVIIYGRNDVNDNNFVGQDYLKRQMVRLQFFLNFIWLLKDNSANFDMAFLQYNELRGVRIDKNFISAVYTNCNGERDTVTLSREELKLARRIFREKFSKEPVELENGTRLQKGINRISIVLYLLQAARSNSDIAIKIDEYCTCLEALFSTGSAELSHQLSERIALFLGDSVEERRDIFSKIKEAYGIRSTIVHGDLLSPSKIKKLHTIVENCDNFLRGIISKFFSDEKLIDIFSSLPEQLDGYFLNLILTK